MGVQGGSKDTQKEAQKADPLRIYTTFISGLGVALLVWSLFRLAPAWPGITLFLALTVVSEFTTGTTIVPQLSFSISSAITFASLLLYGPLPAALPAFAGGLVSTGVRSWKDKRQGRQSSASFWQRAPFNMAALAVPVATAGGLYLLLGGSVGQVASLPNLLPAALAAICSEGINEAIIVGAISLQTHKPALQVWKKSISWAVPISVLSMVVGGGGLAMGYEIAGHLGVGVFSLPILLTIYSFNLYVAQTKAQMERLEEIIDARTEALQWANEDLKRANQAKTRFFSVINHEMRSPLTAIIGYTGLLLSQPEMSADDKEMVEMVSKNGERLLDLVNDILDVSRLEDGRMTLVRRQMDIGAAVQQTLAVVQPMAQEKRIDVHIDIPSTVPPVYADPKRVGQILTNLLSNALKYTPDTGWVIVSGDPNGREGMVEVTVSDSGIGIPADQLPTIFDRFSRVERAEIHDTVGTGLGLSIAKGLIEAHGGEIWVESEEGEGTSFHFTLPEAARFDLQPSVSGELAPQSLAV
jgi:signal transduction histidine kinase